MKSLRIAVSERSIDHNPLILTITEQTHRNTKFGPEDKNYFCATNGVTFQSINHPEFGGVFGTTNPTVYVRGRRTDFDTNAICVPTEEMKQKILEAVEEYNRVFSDGFGLATNCCIGPSDVSKYPKSNTTDVNCVI